MKANELMIGDWVQIIYPDKYDGAKCTIRLIQDGDGCYYRVYIQDANYGYLSYGVFQDDIAPIHLTPEILEKNGFKKDKETDQWYFKSNDRLDLGLLAIGIDDGCGVGICVMPNGAITYYCKYVHELQLFLRVIGGAKEIVL